MKLEFKDYKKKKQLDRIEYLLLKKEKDFELLTISAIWAIFKVIIILLVLSMLFYIAFESTRLMDILIMLFPTFQVFIICVFIFDIVSYYFHRQKVKLIDKFLFKKRK